MNQDQNKAPIFDAAMKYAKLRPAYFCVPGHRYENGPGSLLREYAGDNIFKIDITETEITDDLHCPVGAIKEAQELAAELFGADHTFFLVNGSTCGNQAMLLSAAGPHDRVLIDANSHRSVNSGLIMNGAEPVYVMPDYISEWDIPGSISPAEVEKMFELYPECRAMLVTSPNYYGVISDIRALAEICHRHNALLLVDEAHGTHCCFSEQLANGALACGADMCVQSLHKTGGALTQSSLLHVRSSHVDIDRIRKSLTIVQSSSPSYILLNSIDTARRDLALHGKEMVSRALELAAEARERINAIPGLRCAGRELEGKSSVFRFDETRLVISASQLGISGFALKAMLFEDHNVEVEMADRNNILAIVSYANSTEDIKMLVSALNSIAEKHIDGIPLPGMTKPPDQARFAISPRDAYFAKKKAVSWEEAEGRVCAEMIDISPPGIPLIRPGEIFSADILNYLKQIRLSGAYIQGLPDETMETVMVID